MWLIARGAMADAAGVTTPATKAPPRIGSSPVTAGASVVPARARLLTTTS